MYVAMSQSLPDQHTTKSTHLGKEWVLRIIATPLFAFFIAMPLVSYKTDTALSLVIDYTCFIIVSHTMWFTNRLLLRRLRKNAYWINKPVIKTFSLLSIHLVFSFTLSFLLFYGWNNFIAATPKPITQLLLASVIASVISIVVTFLYEILFLTKERSRDLLQTEKLNHAKIQAELDTLKSQIDPHFIFNSLNTLSALISDDKEKALLFNESLARVYRYILANRANDLVTVKEEMDFINDYFFLLKIRFEDSLHISMNIESLDLNGYYLPTIAMQTAIENAIKHNQFSSTHPLWVFIELSGDYAIISNNKRPVKYKAPSSGLGLINLDNRYKLVLNKSIHIDETKDHFTLYLPIVKK